MRRTIFTEEHEQFRQMVRAFLEKECVPHTQEWLEAGMVSRQAWRKAGEPVESVPENDLVKLPTFS